MNQDWRRARSCLIELDNEERNRLSTETIWAVRITWRFNAPTVRSFQNLARPRTFPQHTLPMLPLLRSRPGGVHKACVVRSPGS